MAARATIRDHFGDDWDVSEVRDTSHPFAVYLGYPSGQERGTGGVGGKRVILTTALAEHLDRHRRDNFAALALPIGATAIKRLRKLLGFHRYLDAAAWWEERATDLASLTLDAFAAKHGCKASAAENARLMLFGKRLRDAGWWRSESVRSTLLSPAPAVVIAEQLGIAASSVRRLRSMLR